jgi:hypothetical protein
MSDTQNVPVPDFGDEDAQAVQAAQNALNAGKNKPLTVPADAQVFVSDKTTARYSRFTEQVTVEKAYRSVTQDGSKIDVALFLRIRQSDVNNGRTLWAHFYIAPTTEGLTENQIEYREKQRGLTFGLVEALGFKGEGGGLTGAKLNLCFPQKNQPGALSPLIGKTVFAEICQVDQKLKDKSGKIQVDDEGVPQRDVRDTVEGWVADDSEAE